jgi:hypothetical protein
MTLPGIGVDGSEVRSDHGERGTLGTGF